MDWDLKMPASWDLTDLAHDAVPAIAAPAPVVAASSIAVAAPAARGPPRRPECSVDLKLGGLGEFGAGAMKEPSARAPVAVPVSTAAAVVPSASPLKRPRPGAGGGGAGHCPSCAVDGCKADLSRCRDYHYLATSCAVDGCKADLSRCRDTYTLTSKSHSNAGMIAEQGLRVVTLRNVKKWRVAVLILAILQSLNFPQAMAVQFPIGVRDPAAFDMKGLETVGFIFLGVIVIMAILVWLYRLYRFTTLEIALRRRKIPFAMYPPKGTAYPAGDVHTICAVCISDFRTGDRIAIIPACGHTFHRRCLRKEVALEYPRCPLCRAALP